MSGQLPMDLQLLPPSSDWVFKRILTDPEAEVALVDLIVSIIGRNVTKVTIHHNDLPTSYSRGKQSRLDVNCTIDDGMQIDLEMQASEIVEEKDGQYQNTKGKSIFYTCALHSLQPARGLLRYDKLHRTWQVTFCTYDIFPKNYGYLNSFSMRHDQDNSLLSNAIHMVFVELNKLGKVMKKPIEDMTDLEKWAIFFGYADKLEYRDTVNKIIKTKEALQVAGELLATVSKNEDELATYLSYRKYEMDHQSNLATSYDNGSAERALDIARKMLLSGFPIEQITTLTGVNPAELV